MLFVLCLFHALVLSRAARQNTTVRCRRAGPPDRAPRLHRRVSRLPCCPSNALTASAAVPSGGTHCWPSPRNANGRCHRHRQLIELRPIDVAGFIRNITIERRKRRTSTPRIGHSDTRADQVAVLPSARRVQSCRYRSCMPTSQTSASRRVPPPRESRRPHSPTRSPRTCSRTATISAPCRNCLDTLDVSTTMIYTHVLNCGGLGVRSPADRL